MAFKRILSIIMCIAVFSGCSAGEKEVSYAPDLVIYTPLDKEMYIPIVREFEDRNGLWVSICHSPEEDILKELSESKEGFEGDIVFGISEKVYACVPELFVDFKEFGVTEYIIIYNSNMVLSEESPEDFRALTDIMWRGKIGFLNPALSPAYRYILEFIEEQAMHYPENNFQDFLRNVQNIYANSTEEIISGIEDGVYTFAVLSDRDARKILSIRKDMKAAPIGEIPCEAVNITAITTHAKENIYTKQFIDFVSGEDVKKYIDEYLTKDLKTGDGMR